MTVEERARRAAHDLRQATPADVEAGLTELRRAMPRRRRAHAAAVVASLAAVLVLVAAPRWLAPEDEASGRPGNEPSVATAPDQDAPPANHCDSALITCHGGRAYTVNLKVPMDWILPRGFQAPYSGSRLSSRFVETYRTAQDGGVTVLQNVSAASGQRRPAAIVPVPDVSSAESFAVWIAGRPFLSSSAVRADRVDGHPAWTVDVELAPGLPPGPATCAGLFDCYPIMIQDGGFFVGAWEGLTSRFTVLDLPGAGINGGVVVGPRGPSPQDSQRPG